MLRAQWILEVTDILMYKIVSFWNICVIQNYPPPPHLKYVPTALMIMFSFLLTRSGRHVRRGRVAER